MALVQAFQTFDRIPFFEDMNYFYKLDVFTDRVSAYKEKIPLDSQSISRISALSLTPNISFSDSKVAISAFSLDKNIADGFSRNPDSAHITFTNMSSASLTFSVQILFLKFPNVNNTTLAPNQKNPSIVHKDFRNNIALAKQTSLGISILFPEDFYEDDSKYLLLTTFKQGTNQVATVFSSFYFGYAQ